MELSLISCAVVCITDSCPCRPQEEFQEASAVAEQSARGDCQAGKVPIVCTHALFLLSLPKDVSSLLNVHGAAVVRAFTGDSGCCCDTQKDYSLQR